jgi:MFS family permease
MYVNSSFLGQFTSEANIGLLYTYAAIVQIIGLLCIEKILERFGNYKTILYLIVTQMALSAGMVAANSALTVSVFFILSTVIVSLIGICLDIFLESRSDAKNTGGTRGLYMTINNSAWVLAPLLGGLLIFGTEYRFVYAGAFSVLIALLYLVHKNLAAFKDPNYGHFPLRQTFAYILERKDYTKLFSVNIILNVFYGWMVIYSPIYLHEHVGFGWDQIGIILTIMLLPFVIFQLPAGKLADGGWGEKKLMSLGLVIIGISCISLAFVTSKSIFVWALLLFVTRIGASIAEAMIEIYFFKKVKPEDSDVLGMFRITRPISYIIAPIITSIGLFYTTDSNLFIILGVIVLCSLYYSLTLKDLR